MNKLFRIGFQLLAVAVALALGSGCGGEAPDAHARDGSGAGFCESPADASLAGPTLLGGDFERNAQEAWAAEGPCAWGDGVSVFSGKHVDGAASLEVSKAGCRVTSRLVSIRERPRNGQLLPFTIRISSMRSDDLCKAGSSTAVHCTEVSIHWYDANGRPMYDELFQVGGPAPAEWSTAEVSGFVSDYAAYYSITVGGSMYGIDQSPVYIDGLSVSM